MLNQFAGVMAEQDVDAGDNPRIKSGDWHDAGESKNAQVIQSQQ
jgi:hypothetical protein